MSGSKTVFCPSKFPETRGRINLKFIENLEAHLRKVHRPFPRKLCLFVFNNFPMTVKGLGLLVAIMILFPALSLPIYKLTVKQFSATATFTDGLKVWGVKTRVDNDPYNCGACSVSFSQCTETTQKASVYCGNSCSSIATIAVAITANIIERDEFDTAERKFN